MTAEPTVTSAGRPTQTTGATLTTPDRVAQLRTGFDRAFAVPPRGHDERFVELLAIQAGRGRYAVRLTQTSGLYCDRPVTSLPGPVPALLGLAGFGGTIVPVYDLGRLLGSPAEAPPRWLVVAAGTPPVALAFHTLDGHVRVAGDEIVTEAEAHGRDRCLLGMVPLPGGARSIIDVPSVRAAVNDLALRGNRP
jgi:chemotaxis signal transduction protein